MLRRMRHDETAAVVYMEMARISKKPGPWYFILGQTLQQLGRPREALEAFRAQPEVFDLVITDMTMPDLTGKDLARELIAIRPEISVILCSGLSLVLDDGQIKEWGIRTLIRKPILKKDLARAVRGVLDQGSKGD